ncbi:hypothetical protein [Flavobacterium rhizosphaerae]|uniref:PepSY domain-containing protein n=1 Tax=Flavobacterium rhizosphaerae TaxID=3163298 RepID=A0ABW8YWR5_9FLAO
MKKFLLIVALTGGFYISEAAVTSWGINNERCIFMQQEKQYKKIKVSEVSKEAMDKIKAGYGSYTVKEAYKAEDGSYKLVLSKDGINTTVTFTPEGELIKILD